MNRRDLLTEGGASLLLGVCGCTDAVQGWDTAENEQTRSDDRDERGNDEREAAYGDGDGVATEEDPRVDEPPQEIERPEPPTDYEDMLEWDDEYLGERMATTPSVPFDDVGGRSILRESRLLNEGDVEYLVDVVGSEADRNERLDLVLAGTETRDRIEAVDFDESVLIVVESGFGSSSVEHRWMRAEARSDALHLHGYYTVPYERLDDSRSRASVLAVECSSADVDYARVSLTTDEDRRVHFNSTEGVVGLDG